MHYSYRYYRCSINNAFVVVYLSDMAILDQNNVTGRNGECKRLIFATTHAHVTYVALDFNTTVRKMTEVWMGDTTYRSAIRSGALELIGPRALIRDVSAWLEGCPFHANATAAKDEAPVPPANEIRNRS